MRKVIAFLLAFLLTGTLVLFGVALVGHLAVAPAMGENGAPVSDTVLRGEKELAKERVAALAELYGFSAEPVAALVDDEALREMNAQASRWWSSVLRAGEPGKEIEWDPESLEEILAADPGLSSQTGENAEPLAAESAREVRKSMVRMVLPVRQQVIQLGLQKAGARVDVPALVTFFLKLPWAALALCALLAGLIALLEGRECRFARVYTGAALGGAALVLVCLAALVLCAGVTPMLHEASRSLELQYQDMVTSSVIRAGVLAAALAAGCVLCLRRGRKERAA